MTRTQEIRILTTNNQYSPDFVRFKGLFCLSEAMDKCQNFGYDGEEFFRYWLVDFDRGENLPCQRRSADDGDAVGAGDFLDFFAEEIQGWRGQSAGR